SPYGGTTAIVLLPRPLVGDPNHTPVSALPPTRPGAATPLPSRAARPRPAETPAKAPADAPAVTDERDGSADEKAAVREQGAGDLFTPHLPPAPRQDSPSPAVAADPPPTPSS